MILAASIAIRAKSVKFFNVLTISLFPYGICKGAQAEPMGATRQLSSQSASVLDIGLLRLQNYLIRTITPNPPEVFYNWGDDQIEIVSAVVHRSQLNLDQAELKCNAWFVEIRNNASLEPKTGKPKYFGTSRYSDFFSRFGYGTAESWELSTEARVELDRKFKLIHTVIIEESVPSDVRSYLCAGAMLDSTFSIEKRLRR